MSTVNEGLGAFTESATVKLIHLVLTLAILPMLLSIQTQLGSISIQQAVSVNDITQFKLNKQQRDLEINDLRRELSEQAATEAVMKEQIASIQRTMMYGAATK